MKLGIKLNLNAIASHTFTASEVLTFTSISNLDNYAFVDIEFVRRIKISVTSISKQLDIYVTSPLIPERTLTDNQIVTASTDSSYISFDCVITDASMEILTKWVSLGLIELNQSGKTTMYCYRLNDEKEKLTKSITPVTIIEGKFTAPIGIKTLEIDVVDYDITNTYNYIFIPKLNRYFYVTNPVLTTKDYTRLVLQEDVLMSWSSLIRNQSAFITRYESSTNVYLVDNRRPLEDTRSYELLVATPTGTGNKVNVTLNFNVAGTNVANYLLVGRNKYLRTTEVIEGVASPVNTNYLPDIRAHANTSIYCYFIPVDTLKGVIFALNNDDTVASFVECLLWLPFNPATAFNLPNVIPTSHPTESLRIGNKWYDNTAHEFKDTTETQPDCAYILKNNNGREIAHSPYLVIFDGTFNLTNDWLHYEPYSIYEINIPFVGLVKIQAKDFINSRILVYYSMELRNGSATAYIYNYNTSHIIWSGSCQLGVNLPLSSTNSLENTRTKQSNDLNMVLGLISSGLAIAGGVVSENPVAIAGGVISAGKTAASYVQNNRMIFDRSQVIFNGSGEGALYSSSTVFVKRTYNSSISIDETTYAHLEGKPYNNYVSSLSALSGYVEVGDIHFDFDNENIYNDEVNEIVALLKNGVIL